MTTDRIDLAIIRELERDGRISHVELAERVGLSPTACARRQRALEEAGLITGYAARLSLEKLDLTVTVIVRIALERQSEEALAAFEKAAERCPAIVRCLLMSGTDDYLVTVVARDIADYERIHMTQLSRLPGVARLHSSFALRSIVDRAVPLEVFAGAAGSR
jgi:Lrp/AsnC family transcriptional regulator, leucine-responsive regulatory protein